MKRKIMYASTQEEYDNVNMSLGEGWVLDPVLYNGKLFILDNAVVFPLVLYESEEEKPKVEVKVGEFDDVTDVKSVEFTDVANLVKEGYVVQSIYAKNTIMVKKK